MPRIEHVALWVADLDRMCAFYAEHFDARIGPRYENPAKGFASRFLSFDSGGRLELMTTRAPCLPNDAGTARMGFTHLALSLGSEARVDELTDRLRAAGRFPRASRRARHGGWSRETWVQPRLRRAPARD